MTIACSETWGGMEEVHALGLAKAIGVSNFNCALLADLLNTCKGQGGAVQAVGHPCSHNPQSPPP